MFMQAGVPIHFHWRLIVILTWNLNVSIFVDTDEAPKLERQYDETNTGICGGFNAATALAILLIYNLTKLSLRLGHGWVFTSHLFYVYVIIYAVDNPDADKANLG